MEQQKRKNARPAQSGSDAAWLILLLAIVAGAPNGVRAQALAYPIVRTEDGAVQGTAFADHQEFLGIPFASPPLGDLRFAPPVRAARWSGVLPAQQFRSSCPQQPGFVGNIPSTDEDCLYLNVYTPPDVTFRDAREGQDAENRIDAEGEEKDTLLPVLVWIHGGGFIDGGAASYIGSQLAASGNIIVVSIQYRLNAFGFLASTALSDSSPRRRSGNYGFEDQQAAIAWVLRNIVAFDGNPRRVTIAGESAGALSVENHLVSPFTPPYEGAIGESTIGIGPVGFPLEPTLSQAEVTGDQFVAAVGCDTAPEVVACLRSLSVDTLLNASSSFRWGPIVDGFDIPLDPNTAIRKGLFRRVPILNGTNLTEGQLFALLLVLQTGSFPDEAGYAAVLAQQFGSALAPAILAEYPASSFSSPLEAYAIVLTDSTFSCPASNAARAISKRSVPVYQYEFNEPDAAPRAIFPAIPGFPWIDPHSVELPYVFGGALPGLIFGKGFTPRDRTPARLALSAQLMAYWTQFVKTGNPNQPGEPLWPRYHSSQNVVQALNDTTGPEFNFRTEHHCDFWDSLN
jgi:para-nitrobenzyl esterase